MFRITYIDNRWLMYDMVAWQIVIIAAPGSLCSLKLYVPVSRHTAQALLRLSRRRTTRLLLLFLLEINVVICLHSIAKSAFHFVLLQKYQSCSGRKGLAFAGTFT